MQWSFKDRWFWIALAIGMIGPCAYAYAGDAVPASRSLSSPSDSCMTKLWTGFLPLIVKNHSYISMDDVERVAAVKMQHVVKVTPMDSIGSYEVNGPVLLNSYDPWKLSIRIEIQDEASLARLGDFHFSWQVAQGRARTGQGSTSVLDFACMGMGELTLSKVEADLQAAGFKLAARSTSPLQQHMEIFANQWGEQTYVYYEVPVEIAPDVISLHIVGMKMARKAITGPGP